MVNIDKNKVTAQVTLRRSTARSMLEYRGSHRRTGYKEI